MKRIVFAVGIFAVAMYGLRASGAAAGGETAAGPLARRLESMVVSRVNFRDVALEQVFEWLEERAEELSTGGEGIEFTLASETSSRDANELRYKLQERRVTLRVRRVSMRQLLEYVCNAAGLAYRLQGSTVLIGDAGEFARRSFREAEGAPPGDDEAPWVSRFVGAQVTVTLVQAPPRVRETLRARLLHADETGVVLEIEEDVLFFPYDNILVLRPLAD